MRFDDHDYTPIRKLLGLIPLRILSLKNNYVLAFKISHNLINSSAVNQFFTERTITYNLRNLCPLTSFKLALYYINFSTTSRLRHSWNLVPPEMINSPTLAIFKRKVQDYLTSLP